MNREHGSMSLVMVAVCSVVVGLSVAVAAIGMMYAARVQAQTAADAAALAAAVGSYPPAGSGDPVSVATAIASDNGARLVHCLCPTDASLSRRSVTVVTSVGARVPIFGDLLIRASSSAEFDPRLWLGR